MRGILLSGFKEGQQPRTESIEDNTGLQLSPKKSHHLEELSSRAILPLEVFKRDILSSSIYSFKVAPNYYDRALYFYLR